MKKDFSRKALYYSLLNKLDIVNISTTYKVIGDRVLAETIIETKDGKKVMAHGESIGKRDNIFRLAETRAILRALEILYSMCGISIELENEEEDTDENIGQQTTNLSNNQITEKQIKFAKSLIKSAKAKGIDTSGIENALKQNDKKALSKEIEKLKNNLNNQNEKKQEEKKQEEKSNSNDIEMQNLNDIDEIADIGF